MNYEVESYLEAAARRFIYSFDPCSYLYLSRSMDWFNVADGYPDLTAALAGIELQTANVIGVETDILFPAHQQKEIADALSANGIKTDFTELASLMGHDAFSSRSLRVISNRFGKKTGWRMQIRPDLRYGRILIV